ncbi:MAG: sigma-70 family RNA polymerase sigma factor [Planctomycetes bacterium]|nr:sigma-70 family RNA polymerase sigma factor [Planctomycetota bacterium]
MPPPDPHHSLLLHAEFLRRLAHDLTRDPDTGDDLAQQVWLRALQRPPHHDGALRGWLVRTAQRLWWNDRRGERRRRSREAAVAAPAGETTTPDRILEREATREEVVRAVMALPEPFRQTLLLHYFDSLRPADIARRLAVPAATVRTRLARGLERVREQLDQQHGDRAAWLPLVAGLPLADLPTPAAFVAPLLMKKLLTTLAALLLLAAGTLWIWSPPTTLPDAAREGATVALADEAGQQPPSATSPAATTTTRSEATAPAAAIDDAPVYPADRAIGQLRVLVHDDRGARAGVEVTIEPWLELPAMEQLRDDRAFSARATSDRDGCCTFTGLPEGPVRLVAAIDDLRATRQDVVSADATRPPALLQLDRPDRRRSEAVVRVTHDGRPVAGATVRLFARDRREDEAWPSQRLPGKPLREAVTDAQGLAKLSELGLESRTGVAIATLAEGLTGRTSLASDVSATNVIELDRPGALRGSLSGAAAKGLRGATLEVCALTSASSNSPLVGTSWPAAITNGRFAVDHLPAGTYAMLLRDAPGARLADGATRDPLPNTVQMQVVEVQAGETTTCELPVVAAARLTGRVTCDGAPVVGATVSTWLLPRFGTGGLLRQGDAPLWTASAYATALPDNPAAHASTRTDADGRYALDGLPPGEHRVEVHAAGYTFDTRFDVPVSTDNATHLEHAVQRAGVLQIATRDAVAIRLQRVGDERPTLHVGADRVFTVPGLAPGTWQVTQEMSATDQGDPMLLATATITAGRTTWLDLRGHGIAARLTGTVRSGATPFAGAIVTYSGQRCATGADGSFLLEFSTPPSGPYNQMAVQANGVTRVLPQGVEQQTHVEVQLGTRMLEIRCSDADGRPAGAETALRARSPADGFERLFATLHADADGVVRIGPLPQVELDGEARLADGYRVQLDIAATATQAEVRPPRTVALTVRVERDGAAMPDVTVAACRWTESGPAPEDQQQLLRLLRRAKPQFAKADANGAVVLQVEPGEHVIITAVDAQQLAWSLATVPDAATHQVTVTGPAR